MSSGPDRFASGVNPAPRWWGTQQTARFLSPKKGGGSGDTPPERVRARGPLAKRLRFIFRRLLRRRR